MEMNYWNFSTEKNRELTMTADFNKWASAQNLGDIWASAWDFQQYGMCDQQSLRSACAVWSEPLLVAWVFYDY